VVREVGGLLGELCMALRGSTVVLKSEGGVAENQGDVLERVSKMIKKLHTESA